ncbi:MAG: hypothetical protein JSW43_03865 [Gemmatimonadota bacterium]|nr:MAG: hypothetical protein JSW43_03865 [Gemmatimonadota bacterium]
MRVTWWLTRSPWRSFLVLFLLSFAIRGFFLTKVSERYVLPHARWETMAIATSLVQTGEFANPYMLPTGPTAHLPPLVPGILALIWGVFGMGLAGGYAGWLFTITVQSTLNGLLPWLGGRLGVGKGPGVLAGIVGALWVVWPGHGEALTAVLLALMLVAFLRRWMRGIGSTVGSLLLGLAIGAALHVQPVLVLVAAGCMAFEVWWSPDRRKWARSAVMALGIVLACAPWGVRNHVTFHEVFFIRSNLGLELRMGNHEGAAAAMDVMDRREEFLHPRTHEAEARAVQELGEVEYMRRARGEALEWIGAHPGTFVSLTAQRFVYFWAGPLYAPLYGALSVTLTLLAALGAVRTLPKLAVPQRAALLIPLATYPLVYYVVAYMPRYRVPLDWILLLLAAAAVWSWIESPAPAREARPAGS